MEQQELYAGVGRLVREAREAARMTQEQLGERIGMTRASVTNIETARQKVQLHTLYCIALVLEVAVTSLLPPTESNENSRIVSPKLRNLINNSRDLRPDERKKLEIMLATVAPSSTPDSQKRGQSSS